jgi:hypothetical protein
MIQLARHSYIMLPIKTHLLPTELALQATLTDDPVFCKTVGDICDEDGSVKPEYAYCKTKAN